MKTTFNSILATLILTGSTLYAQNFESTDFAAMKPVGEDEEEISQTSDEDSGPFKASVTYDFVGAAKIDEVGFKHDHVTFSNVDIGIGSIIYYDAPHKEGIYVSLDYEVTRLKWTNNPFFTQTKYHTATVGLAAFTSRACHWDWQAYIGANIDTDHTSWSYTTYDLLLWGRYEYCEGFGLNGGFVAETGMRADRVVPLLGIDWTINDRWQLNAIFPVNMSINYKIDCNWTAAGVIRIFTSRHRVGEHAAIPEGIWIYRNSGVEGAINYDLGTFHVNFHAGCTLGGRVKVTDREYHHSQRYDLRAAPYVGGEVSYRF